MPVVTTVRTDPARIDIDVIPGEPVDLTVPVYDATGALEDLAAWTLTATVHQADTTLYVFTITEAAGELTVAAPAVDTADWTDWPAAVRWSLWLTPPATQPTVFATGWVRVRTA